MKWPIHPSLSRPHEVTVRPAVVRVVDSSAIIAVLFGEPGGKDIERKLVSSPCTMSTATRVELGIVVEARAGTLWAECQSWSLRGMVLSRSSMIARRTGPMLRSVPLGSQRLRRPMLLCLSSGGWWVL